MVANQNRGPSCWWSRLALLLDPGFAVLPTPKVKEDPLKFRDSKKYVDRLKESRVKTGAEDAVTVATNGINRLKLEVPADAEMVIEGYIDPSEPLVTEGPSGDHTGYYSEADLYPRVHVTAVTMRSMCGCC